MNTYVIWWIKFIFYFWSRFRVYDEYRKLKTRPHRFVNKRVMVFGARVLRVDAVDVLMYTRSPAVRFSAVPKEPDKNAVLSVNSTSATLTFGSWPTQMCAILSFTCQYAASGGGGPWIKLPRQKLSGDTFTVGPLRPATVYNVRVSVHTDAGDAHWEHAFATLTESGGKAAATNRNRVLASDSSLTHATPVPAMENVFFPKAFLNTRTDFVFCTFHCGR